MIITVTMNPAIDKTVEIGEFVHGGLNRIQKVVLDAGGKGINVSKTIKALGGDSIATGFLGGNTGKNLQQMITDLELTADFVKIEEETRTNTKVLEMNGCVTELNESGPCISEGEKALLLEKLMKYAKKDTFVVLSGSVPKGIEKDMYQVITEKMHEKGAKVFVDADGELFSRALMAKPDIVKPNQMELELYFGKKFSNKEELLSAAKDILELGIEIVIISMGAEGAYFLSKEKAVYCPGIAVEAHSTVGAGDAMVAAFTYGMSIHKDFEECAKLAVAVSAGAVTTVGTKAPQKELVLELMKKVKTEYLWL